MGLVVRRLNMRYAIFRLRGPDFFGGFLLNSLALVLTTRSAMALPSGWICWLDASALVGGLGWTLRRSGLVGGLVRRPSLV